MASIAKLDAVYTCTIDCEFKGKINSDGWYSVSPIFSKHEALLVAIMSLAAENWSPIRNRHGWTNPKELKQNKCMSFTIGFCDFTLLNCFKGNGICQAVAYTYRARSTGAKTNTRCVFFPEDFLEYSSVWIDTNSSWLEAGRKRPTELCGRQRVTPNFSLSIWGNTFSGTLRCATDRTFQMSIIVAPRIFISAHRSLELHHHIYV
jgi:hypothetical protein